MSYYKIIQYGNITEVYKYEKNLNDTRRKLPNRIQKKRAAEALAERKRKGAYVRPARSIRRSAQNFFRLCHHNVVNSDTVSFCTITFNNDYKLIQCNRYVSIYFEKIRKNFPDLSVSYISVPELTKKNRYHFHLLIFNLPAEEVKKERDTRNFQRQFQRGYIDLSLTSYRSKGLAGYMAKYMGKALGDSKNEAVRGYNCSRNIKKIYNAGSNSLHNYLDMIIDENDFSLSTTYDTQYLGQCTKTVYNSEINK